MANKQLLSIREVNALDADDFVARFGNVVEHCSLVAAAVWRFRPFTDLQHLITCIEYFLDQLPLSGKEGVLRLHPDLAGRLAREGKLTQQSVEEQAAAGLQYLTKEEQQLMSERNDKYKEKFGFPFVICARKNKKDAILGSLQVRLLNDAETEVITGINEVKKICQLRLQDIVAETA